MSSNGESKLAKSEEVKAFVQHRLSDSLSTALLRLGIKYGTPSSEKLIWELLSMLVDNEGSVRLPPFLTPLGEISSCLGDQ
jgi:hypothetical protein